MEDCVDIVVVLAVLEEIFAGERGLICEERDLDRANRRVERRRRSRIGLAGVLGGHDGQVSYRLTARASSGVGRGFGVYSGIWTPLLSVAIQWVGLSDQKLERTSCHVTPI